MSLDLKDLKRRFKETLERETDESLTKWLTDQRDGNINKYQEISNNFDLTENNMIYIFIPRGSGQENIVIKAIDMEDAIDMLVESRLRTDNDIFTVIASIDFDRFGDVTYEEARLNFKRTIELYQMACKALKEIINDQYNIIQAEQLIGF